MPFKNAATSQTITVWDNVNGIGKTGQSATLTLRGVGDGTNEFTPSAPVITEVDSTNLKGEYSVTITSGENIYSNMTLGGLCSTAGCIIVPLKWTNETTTPSVGTVAANVTQIDGVALATHASGEMPSDIRAVNGGSTGATAGKLELTGLSVVTGVADTDAVFIDAQASDGYGITVRGDSAVKFEGSNDGSGLAILGNGVGSGLFIQGGATSTESLTINGAPATNADTIGLHPDGTGKAINALGQVNIAPTGDGVSAVIFTGSGRAGLEIASNDSMMSSGNAALNITSQTGTAVNIAGNSEGGGNADGVFISSEGTGSAITLNPDGTGKAINALGQVLIAPMNTNDDALVLTPSGTGLSINAIVEGLVGIVQSLMLANAANAGKTSGMSTANVTIRDVNDTKDRITANVDTNGNRLTITLDLT